MRKVLFGAFCLILAGLLVWKISSVKPAPRSDDPAIVEEKDNAFEDERKEDGIRLAQEQDFENTKDISLGYIPEARLIQTTSNLLRERKLHRVTNINSLSWTERGPNTDATGPSNGNFRGPGSTAVTSGRIRAIWVDLADATQKTVWVGGVDGGLWKTTDISASPATWAPVNDFFGNLAIASICQDPTDLNTMYFGTGEKTFNVDAVRGGGIWRSTDHGITWNLMAGTSGFFNVSRIACDGAGNLYVATIGASGVQRFNKALGTWSAITPSGLISYATDLKISSTGRLHVVCGYTNSGASGYRFTDNPATVTSATWTSPATTFPTTYNAEIAVVGNVLYSLPANSSYETPVVYKSTDGGANWITTTTLPSGISSGQGWYNIAVGIDPANTNNVIVGGLNTYRSTNAGGSWTQVAAWVGTSMPYIHADQHFVTWNGSQVLMSSDGGLFYSADGGVSWSDRNAGLRIKQFYSCAIHPTSTNYFIGGAQDNGMHQMNNAGLGGSTEFVGGDGTFSHIDQDEPQYQFGAYTFNDYFRSTDGGTSWSNITYSTSLGKFVNPSDYDNGNNKMYAAYSGGQYVRWENPQTGSTFTPVAIAAFNGSVVNHVSVSPYTSNRVFFGTSGGRVVRVDGADQASPVATNITGTGMTASAVSCIAIGTTDNNLIATFSNYGAAHVWVSSTGGGAAGWTDISGDLPDIPVRWAMFYPYDNTRAILATEAGVYETDNINGASTVWTQNPSFPIVRTDMLQFRTSDNLILAATHGRGMWSSTAPVAAPYIQFANAYASHTETNTSTSGCRTYKDYTVNMTISNAPAGTATATLDVSGGAMQGVDFDFTTNGNFAAPSNVVTFANGSNAQQPVTIRVYDDADAEPSESFTLSYTLSGATNAQAGPCNQIYTFVINDNDAGPVVPTTSTVTVGNNNFSGCTQPFRGTFEKSKSQFIYLASELSAAGLTAGTITSLGINVTSKSSTAAYNGLTISLKNTTTSSYASASFEAGATACYSSNYSTVSGMNTFTLTTPFNWDGTSNLLVEICYDNPTGNLPGNVDVVAAHSTSDDKGLWNRASTGTGCSLAGSFNSFSGTFVRPDLTLTGAAGNAIETVLSASKTNYIGNNGNYYFFNAANNNIISKINNASADLGCVSSIILSAGTVWQSFLSGQRSQKVFTITPTTNSGASYTVGLYFTAAELAGKSPATLKIAKTSSATIAGADASNTITATTSFVAYGSGYLFTGSFTGFSNFFLVDNAVILPVSLLSFEGHLNKATAVLNWSTSSEYNSRNFEVEKSSDGVNYFRIGTVDAAGYSTIKKNYTFTDTRLGPDNYYRLRMNDNNNAGKLSSIVLLHYGSAKQTVWIVNNPFSNYIDLRLAKTGTKVKLQLVAVAGNVVAEKTLGSQTGQIRWNLPATINSGNYIVRAIIDGEVFASKVVKQ